MLGLVARRSAANLLRRLEIRRGLAKKSLAASTDEEVSGTQRNAIIHRLRRLRGDENLPTVSNQTVSKDTIKQILLANGSVVIAQTEEDWDRVTAPIDELIRQGVTPTTLFELLAEDAASRRAVTLDWPRWKPIFESIQLTIACRPDDVLGWLASINWATTAEKVEQILLRVADLKLEEKEMRRLLDRVPELLAADEQKVAEVVEFANSFFSRKELSVVVHNCPEFLLLNAEKVELNYEYVFYQMWHEAAALAESKRWALLSLEEIRARHLFLEDAGKLRRPDPKKPHLTRHNPPLNVVFDTNDRVFAQDVAGVSQEEWLVYRANLDKIHPEDEEAKHPFEKTKPTMRKKGARAPREAPAPKEHVLEGEEIYVKEQG